MSAPITSTPLFYLQPGYVAIYGNGSVSGTSGIKPTDQNFLFGNIYQIWDNGGVNAQVGDSVLFNKNDIKCRLLVSNWPYTIIEQVKLVITEIPPVSL